VRYYIIHIRKMFDDPTELQAMLDEAAGNLRVKPRTASLDDAHKLLEEDTPLSMYIESDTYT
jgi:hypothetical protein